MNPPTLYLVILFIILNGCNKESSESTQVIFRLCPVDTAAIFEASPLGNLNPPGHTFPSNHIGFYLKGNDSTQVRAMTEGRIRTVYYNEWSDDFRIEFDHSESVISYFDHICSLSAAIVEGADVNTGDMVGYARRSIGAFDIGVVNYEVKNSFIIPARYHEFYLYYDDPYSYFTDSIRELLELKNPRIGEPKGGKVDYDVDGTLAGNWFLPETPLTYEASSYLFGQNQLAFVYAMYNSSIVLISCGGTLEGAPFVCSVAGNTPDPVLITPASGLIKYQMQSSLTESILIIQMRNSRTIEAEVFINKLPSEVEGFSSNSKIYMR